MEAKIYYGEYSLRHWIELMLKGNIVLPPYQRNFVWTETKVLSLINAFTNKEFVPPITIGLFKKDGVTENLILDGQQRLTTLLLAYLDLMPDAATFKAKNEELTMGRLAEGDEIDEYGGELDDILDWTFQKLTEKGKSKSEIESKLIPGNYKNLDKKLPEIFFEERYLGFSYIVPQEGETIQQQKFYSTAFRNINIGGQALLAQESREALYYFNSEMPDFFNPSFCKEIKLKTMGSNIEIPLDFVRYMSILSQYRQDGNETKLAKGYRSNMEGYYEQYIYSVLGELTISIFKDFNTIFPDKNYQPKLERLSESIRLLDLSAKSPFSSIIDMDVYLFGLIYQIVFESKKLNPEHINDLKMELSTQINDYKSDDSHKRSPNAFKYMRPRVVNSINIYSRYVIAE